MAATENKRLRERPVDAWCRELADGRTEVLLKDQLVRIRMSGSIEQVNEIIERFEEWTGRSIEVPWVRPPRRGPTPIQGQLDILSMTELESEGNDG